MNFSKKIIFTLICLLGVCLIHFPAQSSSNNSKSASEAMDVLAKYFVKAARSGKMEKLGRTALMISLGDELDQDLKPYLQNRIEELLRKRKTDKLEIVNCLGCEAIRAHSDGNRVVIEKGLSNDRVAHFLAKEGSIDTFMLINVSHTGSRMALQYKAVSAADLKTKYQKTISIHTRFLSDKSFIFSLDLGPAYITTAASNEDKFGAGVAVFFGERFYGLGKIGFAATSVISVGDAKFNQASGPYLSANLNELIGMHWGIGDLSLFVNPSYAVSDKSIGFLMRGGLVFELGNFTHVSAEYQRPLYSQNPSKKYPTSIMVSFGFDIF